MDIRVADFSDIRAFNLAVSNCGGANYFKAMFGQLNLPSMLENCLQSYIAIEDDSCFGFLAVSDAVSLSGEADYISTLDYLKEFLPVRPTNVMFINFWLLDERHKRSDAIGKELLFKVFDSNPYVDFVLWAGPRGGVSYEFVDRNFSVLSRPDVGSSAEKHTLPGMDIFFIERAFILPRLMVRDARIEDSDDLLPIVKESSAHLGEGQEASAIAELISAQDANNRFFVGCSNDSISGMLATSTEVNVSLIQKIFDIDHFPDLLLPKEEMPALPPLLLSVVGDIRLIDAQVLVSTCNELNCLFVNAEKITAQGELMSGVNALEKEISDKVAQAQEAGKNPLACVVFGFPRNETDADALLESKFQFDAFLELQNTTEDADIDDNDEFCNAHVDGIEVLRNHWFDDENSYGNTRKVQWQKLLIDTAAQSVSESVQTIVDEISGVVKFRAGEVAKLEQLYREEPQKANAFAIVSFSMKKSAISRAEDLMRVAFEDNSQKDYALYMVPCNAAPSRLLDFMTPVQLRPGVSFDQCLFVVHRDFLNASDLIEIKRLEESQVASLSRFLGPRPPSEIKRINALCESALREADVDIKENPGEVCFVACIDGEIVAIMNLSRKVTSLEDVNWLRQNYDLDDLSNFDRHRGRNQACIVQWYVNPIYVRWSKFMLREVMRQYSKTLLYFNELHSIAPSPYVVQEMLAVRPRRRTQIHPNSLLNRDNTRPSDPAFDNTSQLFVLTKRQVMLAKPTVLSRILVVGGNMSSFALLETICFLSKLYVPNIYLVLDCPPSTLSLEGQSHIGSMAKYIDDMCGCLTPTDTCVPFEQELQAMGLAHRVTLVTGKLTDIDRNNRAIVVSDEIILEYDVLVIANNAQDLCFRKFPSIQNLHPAVCAERGVFGLGNPRTDFLAMKWLKGQHGRFPQIVVYGNPIRGLNAVGRLIKYGVDPSNIILIVNSKISSAFEGEDNTLEAIKVGLQASGVTYYENTKVKDITLSHSHLLDGVILECMDEPNPHELVEKQVPNLVTCGTLLCCTDLTCDFDTFSAVNESGLIFDSGLVVDSDCRTIDPFIFAIGQFTRVSKVYKNVTPHGNYNARETGVYCALKIVELFLDPQSPKVNYSRVVNSVSQPKSIVRRSLRDNQEVKKPPSFKSPVSIYCDFPGNCVVFFSQLPNFNAFGDNISNLVTTDTITNRFCSLKLDGLGIASRFVYVGNSYIEERNFSQLVGWHDNFLNVASFSYERGLVTDWVSFFRQDWALILYFDKFSDFANTIRLNLQTDKGIYSILDRVFELADSSTDDSVVASGRRQFVGDRCESIPESTTKSLETYGVDFLRKHKASLTRFYVPGSNK